ncbi:MAG: biotin/lipoyl-binding protein [Thermodesulfobacteriales bacterium]|nr:MAG: biotin/lipoyl-binding protein [Thermodesulfobacteriales bacterium]
MTIEYKLPDLGEDIETGDVIGVFVSVGDTVVEDQALLEIETDKAAIEIPAPAAGTIKEVHIKEGDTIKVGQLLVTIDDGKAKTKGSQVKEVAKTQDEVIEEVAEKEVEEEMDADPESEPQEVELNTTQDLTENSEEKEIPDTAEPLAKNKNAVPASPTTRRMARELGIDINLVEGTGPGGRISEDDIRNYAPGKRSKPKSEPQAPEPPVIEPQDPKDKASSDKWGNIDRTPMSKVRRLTAERLTKAWTAPHVTQYDKADITELEKLRKEFGDSVAKAGGKLTMTSIILKVIASALKAFPEFNASVDMENGEILYKKYYNIGVAVDTDRGLLVPVIKDVNKKNITKLSVELSELSEKARNKKITVDELQGGTFTISNLGGIGGTYFSPVLNAPEVAILGISRSAIEPVYIDGGFLPRLMLPLSLSYDHRLIDGADAIRFLRWIIEALEEPFKIPLEG